MRCRSILFASLMIGVLTTQIEAQIRWQSDLQQAQTLAAQTNRLVVVHFWAPWCQPCLQLDRNVFSQPGLGQAVEASYVPVKLNLDEYPALAREYGVTGIPADVVLTPSGALVETMFSPPTADEYVRKLNGAQSKAVAMIAQNGTAAAPPYTQNAPPQMATQPPAQGSAYGSAQPAGPPIGPRYASADPQATYGATPGPAPTYTPAQPPAGPTMPAQNNYVANNQAAPSVVGDRYADFNNNGNSSNQYEPSTPAIDTGYQTTPPAVGTSAYGGQPQAGQQMAVQPAPAPQQTIPAAPAQGAYGAYGQPAAPQQDRYAMQQPAGQPPAQGAMSPQVPHHVSPSQPMPANPAGPMQPQLALDGHCPVTLTEKRVWQPGDKTWGADHRGRRYLFAGEEEQRRFLTNPDHYSPVNSGYDPVAMLDQNRVAAGFREHGVFYNGRIYLFENENTLNHFSRNPTRYAAEALEARLRR